MNIEEDIRVRSIPPNGDLREFLKVPWTIQRHDPFWVPPILSEQRSFLNPKSGPFFEIGEAQYFLALKGGQPAGRISAHINHKYEELHDARTGFFGFFECVPDTKVSAALFDAASAWLRMRGKSRILGPLNFSIYDEIGVLVEGFHSLPAVLQTHNPAYYQDLLLDWGFKKAIDWYAYRVTSLDVDAEAMKNRLDRMMRSQSGLILRSPNPGEIIERSWELCDIFNEAWSSNWGHIPFTRRQFADIFSKLRPILRRDLIRVIFDGDKLAAFIVNIPDLNPSIQKLNGRLYPWDQARLLYEARFKPLRKVRTLLLGVRREYQRRLLHHPLILSTYLHLLQYRDGEACDCSLVPEQLQFWLKVLESYGAKRYKTWRIFEREIPATPS